MPIGPAGTDRGSSIVLFDVSVFMARCILLLGIASLLVGSVTAQPDSLTHRLETANAAYEQGRYPQAIEMYKTLLETGRTNGVLYYNLGNAYARIDRLGPAIRYYEKARPLLRNVPRLAHNLEQVRRRAGVYPERLRRERSGLLGLLGSVSPLALFVAGGLVLGSGALVAVVWTRPSRPDGWNHPLVWGLVGAGLLLGAGAMATSYLHTLDRYAVVVTGEAVLRAQPHAEARSDTTLPEGVLLEVRSQASQWYEVQHSDEVDGWLPARAIGEI